MIENRPDRNKANVLGRIDEFGKVLLPIVLVASDGFELELEASINLEFAGALVVPETLARSVGWRCLGGRRVMVGVETKIVHHYIGLMAIGGEPRTVVVLGGLRETPVIGQKLLSGRTLSIDFQFGKVTLS